MVDLFPAKFRKRDFVDVPSEALLCHCLIAQIANEAIIFRKVSIAALLAADGGTVMERAAVAITQLTTVMSAARLIEAKDLLNHPRFKKVREIVHPLLDEESLAAHTAINKYFGKPNLLYKLRNKLAFHFDIDTAEAAVNGIHDQEYIEDYHSKTYGNAFYGSGAMLTAFQFATIAGIEKGEAGIDQLFDEIRNAVHWFETYAASFLIISAQRFFGADIREIEANKLSIQSQSVKDVRLPYFMDDDKVTESDFL